ncbi:MAG TPA: hypothetical protein VM204_09160 [Gaiellaceae bacterium]|nr:hypothetical protein [Gaiellaceae bacterium]
MSPLTIPAFPCPVCDRWLPPTGNKRRRVPSRGGRRMLVHAECADVIDRQVELAAPDGTPLGARS